ncbi:hypothetical protein [Cesiribacter sp. SM1]|uniref:LIC_10190 family membrane protein n=1 Tax=Cesiribacter sp. SM1 TaxID=2861196 RepID=UPI001CD6D7BF|nr:hypothetical protein [Cesiribacter sp. SM1]
MLLVLLAWLYALSVSYVYGHALISALSFVTRDKDRIHFSLYIIGGFAVLTALTTCLAFYIKIAVLANIIILIPALLYALIKAKSIRKDFSHYKQALQNTSAISYIIFLVAVAMGLALSASPQAKFDDGLYYQQTIKWIESYPAITGLGNLHLKLSFNSGWHVLSALFSFSFLGMPFNDLNGLLFIVVVVFALEGLQHIIKGNYTFSDVFKVVTIAPLHLLFTYIVSPSPDLVIPYITWVVFILFLQKIEQNSLQAFDVRSMLILIFSLFAVIIKLSAAPIALLSFYLLYLQLKQQNYRSLVPVTAAVIMLAAPWMARSAVLSGYLVYPFCELDVLAVDWKIPEELVKVELTETRSFAKIRRMLFTDVDRLSIAEWLPHWFWELNTSERLIVMLIIVLGAALPVAAIIRLRKEKITLQTSGILVLFLTVYAGIFFWFFTAPHFRYGMGFTVGLYLLCMSYFLYLLIKRFSAYTLPLMAVFLLVFFSKPIYNVLWWYKNTPEDYLVYPVKAVHEGFSQVKYQGIDIWVPDSTAQCWDAPLPCAPFIVEGLELRTGKLTGGFRITRPNSEAYTRKRLKTMGESGLLHNILNNN